MNIVKKRDLDWSECLNVLTPGAYYLLSVLWHKDFPVSDKSMMEHTGYGLSTHRLHKRELINGNFLAIKQVGKGVYKYLIGEGVTDGEF